MILNKISRVFSRRYIQTYTFKKVESGMFSQKPNCPYCKGTRIHLCTSCKGLGMEYKDVEILGCSDCKGYGYFICMFCGGNGLNHLL